MYENNIILNFTPTGMIPTKKMTPFVPITTSEITEEVIQAYELGITMVHLHARDENGFPTYQAKYYEPIIEKIRKYCPDLILCTSLSGRNVGEFEKRSEVLELKPDMASLTLGSLNSPNVVISNSPDIIKRLALKMQELGVHPELECFDSGMINYGKYLISKNILKPPFYFNLIFGMISNAQSDLISIGSCLAQLPEKCIWSLGGVGRDQLKVNTIALALNGGVRIGLEDNIWWDNERTKLATNIDLIKRIKQLAEIMEKSIMTSQTFANQGFKNGLL